MTDVQELQATIHALCVELQATVDSLEAVLDLHRNTTLAQHRQQARSARLAIDRTRCALARQALFAASAPGDEAQDVVAQKLNTSLSPRRVANAASSPAAGVAQEPHAGAQARTRTRACASPFPPCDPGEGSGLPSPVGRLL